MFGRQILTEKQEAIVAILSKPKFEYMGGRLRPWDEAMLHIGCEAVTRGLKRQLHAEIPRADIPMATRPNFKMSFFKKSIGQARIVNPSLPC